MDFKEKALMVQGLINDLSSSPEEAIAYGLFVAVNVNDLTIKKENFSVGIDKDFFNITIKKKAKK